jgi:hypothetical protein
VLFIFEIMDVKMKKEAKKIVLAFVFCAFFAASSYAATRTWLNPGVAGNNKWNVVGNWNTGIPIAGDTAVINNAKECIIGTDMVGAAKAIGVGTSLLPTAGIHSFLTIKGELAITGNFMVGQSTANIAGALGTVRIDPGAVVSTGVTYIGYAGDAGHTQIGEVNVMGGTYTTTAIMLGGQTVNGDGVLALNGGTTNVTTAGHFFIGALATTGKGKLTVNNGARLITTNGCGLYVGRTGTGEMTINSGGYVKAAGNCQSGSLAGSLGATTMNGGTLETASHLYIGALTANNNFMQLNNDANVTVGGQLFIAPGQDTPTVISNAVGRLTIAGTAKMKVASVINLGDATVGTGSATIELQAGTLTGLSTLVINSGSALNKINITGGTLILPTSQLSAVNGYIASGKIYTSLGDKRIIKVATTATQVIVTTDLNMLKLAYNPVPADGSAAKAWTTANILLQWSPGDGAASHKIYAGTDYNDVNDGVAGVYQGEQLLGDETFSFNLSTTLHPTTLYWRVDEFDGTTTWKGAVWKQDIFVCQREDLNMDYTVDGNDLRLLVGQWLESGSVNGDGSCAENMTGDINGDCKVDFSDFAMLSNNWKKQSWHFQEPTIKDKLGATHAVGRYYGTTDDFLNEGADKLLTIGTHIIKILFDSSMQNAYPWNSVWPQAATPLQRAQLPYVAELFEKPFTTYILMVTEPVADWHNGMTPEQQAQEQQSFYELTRFLLHKYSGTGKTFVLQHWEGDWLIRGHTNPSVPPTSQAIAGMIQWLNARQAGVNQARNEFGFPGVRVFNAAEINLVVSSMDLGYVNMVTEVLPYVNVDLVSYSAWDATVGFIGQPQKLHDALDYIASHANNSQYFGDKNIYIGEFGLPENEYSQQNVATLVNDTINTAFDWGCQYVMFWQLYCNELVNPNTPVPVTNNNDVRGFWLIRPDGTFSWAYTYLRSFLQ